VVFVTGGNGSGKSTFIKILSGLYPPQGGRIVWDGAVVDETNRGAYRSLFSIVLPDDPLLADVLEVPPLPQDDDVLRQLSPGPTFNPAAPGSSKSLSYGQRSRVALLEAYARDRPILVLDEWAANQDPHRRRLFYEELVPALRAKGKCVVVISHDDAFFGIADVRLHLDRGRIDQVVAAPEEATEAAS
jgi:putative ATP-binding cassette transporter